MLTRIRRVMFEASFYLVMIATAYVLLFSFVPWLETRFLPVVGKLQIESVAAGEEGTSIIRASFRNLRDCEYLGISWFRGKPDSEFERVPVIRMRLPGDNSCPNRPLGFQRAGPWGIGVMPDESETNSFAVLHHRCHPLWTSHTEFYP